MFKGFCLLVASINSHKSSCVIFSATISGSLWVSANGATERGENWMLLLTDRVNWSWKMKESKRAIGTDILFSVGY